MPSQVESTERWYDLAVKAFHPVKMAALCATLIATCVSCSGGGGGDSSDKAKPLARSGKVVLVFDSERRDSIPTLPEAQGTDGSNPSGGQTQGQGVATVPIRIEIMGRLDIEGGFGQPGPSVREFLPITLMKTGESRQFPIGTRNDGAIITYQVGKPEKGTVPITISLEMWGTRRASSRFIANIAPGESRSFMTTARGAASGPPEILRLTLSYEALDPLPDSLDVTPLDAQGRPVAPGAAPRVGRAPEP